MVKGKCLFLGVSLFSVVLLPVVGCKPGAPLADFRARPTTGPAPLNVQFTDVSQIAKSTGITGWAWDFGDGNTSTEQHPAHVYSIPGNYTLSLTVTTEKGKTNTATVTDCIHVDGVMTIALPGGVPLEMAWIPAGTFQMGRYPGEQDSHDSEDPQHQVTVPGFWMGKYEVTQAQWRAVMGDSPSRFSGHDNRPVERVSWDVITRDFLPALNAATGHVFRLPSEAEWEYAARAGTTTRFYWGDDPDYSEIGDHAWHEGNSGMQTRDVGGKLPNAWGLYDMSGNVYEWVQDLYHEDYTNAPGHGGAWEFPVNGNRWETSMDSYRMIRGGGWECGGGDCRSSRRHFIWPDCDIDRFGFRLSM